MTAARIAGLVCYAGGAAAGGWDCYSYDNVNAYYRATNNLTSLFFDAEKTS